jgi:hypothetical protein
MCPRAVLDVVVKRKIPSPHWELNPRTRLSSPQPSAILAAVTALILSETLLNGNLYFIPAA